LHNLLNIHNAAIIKQKNVKNTASYWLLQIYLNWCLDTVGWASGRASSL